MWAAQGYLADSNVTITCDLHPSRDASEEEKKA